MEQGFDSLSLTQVAFAIRNEFSVKVSFTQLMNQLPNIDTLAEHLDATLPADILAETPPTPAGPPVPPPASVSRDADVRPKDGTLEEVVADQARTIARLVGLLEKSGCIRSSLPPFAADSRRTLGRRTSQTSTHRPRSHWLPFVRLNPPFRSAASMPPRASPNGLSASYNESMTVRFTGNISIEKMTRAMERLVARHDALRASFDEAGLVMKIARDSENPAAGDRSFCDQRVNRGKKSISAS